MFFGVYVIEHLYLCGREQTPSIQPKIPKISKWGQMARKYPTTVSRKSEKLLNFRKANQSTENYGGAEIPGSDFAKFGDTVPRDLGCSTFVSTNRLG